MYVDDVIFASASSQTLLLDITFESCFCVNLLYKILLIYAYFFRQATEKSLKAAWFAKDANKVPRLSHDISAIAMMIGSGDISNCVADLADLTGNYAKMRYLLKNESLTKRLFVLTHDVHVIRE